MHKNLRPLGVTVGFVALLGAGCDRSEPGRNPSEGRQTRPPNPISDLLLSEPQRTAASLVNRLYRRCESFHMARSSGERGIGYVYEQVAGLDYKLTDLELSEADQLNGIEYGGRLVISMKGLRRFRFQSVGYGQRKWQGAKDWVEVYDRWSDWESESMTYALSKHKGVWYLSAGILSNVQQRVDGFAEQPPCSAMPPTGDDTTPEQFVRWVKALPEVEQYIAEMRRQYPEFE